MMISVLCIFAVCWLPYHIYFILQHHLPEITSVAHAQHIFLALYWLAMSNSMYNPFIYCWMNSRSVTFPSPSAPSAPSLPPNSDPTEVIDSDPIDVPTRLLD
jgi:hypothetical protein